MKETELLVKASNTTRHSTNFQARFVRREKSLLKVAAIKKGDLSISCLLKESASILEQTSRSYGGLKLGLFVTK